VNTTTEGRYGQPALVGGLVMGVLSALPLISAGNVCCCLWVLAGGMVAAYLLQQNQAAPIQAGDGALVGLLAGLIGALVQLVVSIPISLLVGPMERAIVQRVLDMAGNMPSDMREVFERYNRGGQMAAWWVFGRLMALMFWLCIGAVFSTIGGLIGTAIFKKNTPPGTIDVTPTTPVP
jgi:uncharacterized protein YqgC (DUF456 family)